jgi:Protein of unknown function (DUF2786)
MAEQSVIEKIRKLKAMTVEHGCSEAEAAAASQAMFTLLAKYNLSITEIADSSPVNKVGQEQVSAGLFAWESLLYQSVAHLNFCEYLKGKRSHIIVGRPADSVTTKEMASYLIDTICKLAEQAAEKQPAGERWNFLHAFRIGASARLRERIAELEIQARAGKMKAADKDSLLPALANIYQTTAAANQAFLKSHFGKLKHTKVSTKVLNGKGYAAGSAAANSVGLNKQVGKKSSHTALN